MFEDEEETCLDQQELLIHDKQKTHEKLKWKRRLLKTVTLSMAFFCLGLCIAIPGPTLLDLGRRVNRDTEHMTFIFTARSIGFLIGSLVGGILFDFFDQQLLLFYTLAVAAVATAGVPWCSALSTLSALISMQGVAFGVLDTGGNVFCIKIWGKRSGPFLQILHFAFGVGAFLAPLIAQPFLMDGNISGNSTKGNYHVVNFRTISVTTVTAGNRLARDVFSPPTLDEDYSSKQETFYDGLFKSTHSDVSFNDDTDLYQISTGVSPRPINNLFTDKRYVANDEEKLKSLQTFQKKQNSTEIEIGQNLHLGNETQLPDNATEQNLTTSDLIPNTSTKRPMKPGFSNGGVLNKDLADAASIDSKLKDLKDKSPQKIEVKTTTAVLTPVGHDVNVTFENVISHNENVTNNAQDLNNTGHFSVTRASSMSTSVFPTIITSTPTASTTIPATTSTAATVATIMTSAAVTSTSTSTIFVTTVVPALVEASGIVTITSMGNRSTIVKPKTTGDFLRDMVATIAGMSRIQFAYSVIGLLLAFNAGLFLFLHCKDRSSKSQPSIRRYRDPTRNPYTKCFVTSIILQLFLFFLAYMGMEVTLGGLLTTFAVYYPSHPWTPAQGASLTSLFWGCLALGRGVAIFIARCVTPSSMMVLNLCLTVVGAVILSFGVPVHPALLWIGTVTIGLGMSSLFPTAISWADSHYPLSGRSTAVFVAGCGIGEMSIPVLTGHLYEKVSHMAVMYVILFLSCLLSMLYLSVQLLVRRKNKSIQRRSHVGSVHLKNTDDDVEESDVGIIEGITLGITETTWRRRVQGEEERKKESGEGNITEFTKLMEM